MKKSTIFCILGLILIPTTLLAQQTKFMSKKEIKEIFLNPKKSEPIEGKRKKGPAIAKEDIPTLEDLLGTEKLKKLRDKKAKKSLEENIFMAMRSSVDDQKGVDLRYRDTPVKQQFVGFNKWGWRVGTCTAFGLVSAMENLINNPKVAHLSERHLWSHYKVTSMEEAIMASRVDYITEEAYWPQGNLFPRQGYLKQAHTRVKSYYELDDSIIKAIEYLDKGLPVYLGFSTPSDMYDCKAVVKSKSNTGGGHAVAIVGYQLDSSIPDSGYFIVKNSWDSDCGDRGYHYLPFYYCKAYNNYCLMYGLDSIETDFPSLTTE